MTEADHGKQMSNSIKGVITCPLCGKEKFFVYPDSQGHVSIHCAKCGRLILLDSDNLTAEVTRPIKNQNTAS